MGADASANKESKKTLFNQLDNLKNEILDLRKELNKIHGKKESWFHKNQDCSKKIREEISIIRGSREKRDSLTKKVKGLKEKRNALSLEAGKKISEYRKLSLEKDKLLPKSKLKNPILLKAEIGRIETRLETEAMPFDKEKKLYKSLKTLKKSLEDMSDYFGLVEKIKCLNKEIYEAKKNANAAHNEIQESAGDSQLLHENIIKSSKEVDKLKADEEEAFKNFITYKTEFRGINHQLKESLAKMSGIREKINKFNLEENEKRKLNETMLIQSKEKEIEEKFKAGKKLTTDDFLMFQENIKGKKPYSAVIKR